MTPGTIAVYNSIKDIIPNTLVYYQPNQMLSDQASLDVIDIVDNGDSTATFKVTSTELGIILTDRNINVAYKYRATINNAYTELEIVSHTADTSYDYLTIANVPPVVLDGGSDVATVISLMLVQSVAITTEPFPMDNFNPRRNTIISGEGIVLSISTKFDENREVLTTIQETLMEHIMTNHRKFDIYRTINSVPVIKGYYKLTGLPTLNGYVDEFQNNQAVEIGLEGYYTIDYS